MIKISKKFSIVGLFTVLGGFIAFGSLYLALKNDRIEHGTDGMSMSIMNNRINNNEERNIFICFSSPSDDISGIGITPTYDNSSAYPIKDFDLRYQLETTGFIPEPNPLYEIIRYNDLKCQYKYQENVLPQYSQIHEPFSTAKFPKTNNRFRIVSRATYPGAPYPYQITVNVWMRQIPRQPRQSFEDWRLSCKQVIYKLNSNVSLYDAHYISRGEYKNEFGVDFGPTYMASTNVENIAPKSNTPKQNTSTATTAKTITEKVTPDTHRLEIVSFEHKTEGEHNYLYTTFNQPTKKNEKYYIAFHTDKPYRGYRTHLAYGNGQNTLRVELLNKEEEISLVCLPVEDNSLKGQIDFEQIKDDYLKIINNSDTPVFIIANGKNYTTQYITINNNSDVTYRMSKEDIVSYKTYSIQRVPKTIGDYFGEIVKYVGMGVIIIIGIFTLLWYKKEKDNLLLFLGLIALSCGILGLFSWALFCIPLFLGVAIGCFMGGNELFKDKNSIGDIIWGVLLYLIGIFTAILIILCILVLFS